jgi:hypothetical protein
VHLACTRFLTHMHTGTGPRTRSTRAACCPANRGFSSATATTAATATSPARCMLVRCASPAGPEGPVRVRAGGPGLGTADGRAAHRGPRRARDARADGKKALDLDVLGDLVDGYRAIAASGLDGNVYRRTATAKDGRWIARRFIRHEDMILRFITRPDLDIFMNNEAERRSVRSRSPSVPPGAAGAPSTASPTSPSFSPTCPPPRNGASPRSTPSAAFSAAPPGCRPASNPSYPHNPPISPVIQQGSDAC